MGRPVRQPDPGQCLHGEPTALAARHPRVQQAGRDVLRGGKTLDEMELLEDEAKHAAAQRRQLPVGQPGDILAADLHGPARRPVQGAHDVEQGRLSRPGRPDDGDELAALDGQRHVVERGHVPWIRHPGLRVVTSG